MIYLKFFSLWNHIYKYTKLLYRITKLNLHIDTIIQEITVLTIQIFSSNSDHVLETKIDVLFGF